MYIKCLLQPCSQFMIKCFSIQVCHGEAPASLWQLVFSHVMYHGILDQPLSLHSIEELWRFCQNFCPFSFCWQHLCPADDEYLWTVWPQCRVRNVMKFYQNVRYGMLTVCWYFAVFLVIIMEGENVVAVEYSKVPFCCCRPDFSFEKRFWSGQTALSTVELMNGAICLFSVGRYGQCVQMIHLLLPWFAVLLSCVLTMSSVNSGSAALWCPLLLISLQQHSD